MPTFTLKNERALTKPENYYIDITGLQETSSSGVSPKSSEALFDQLVRGETGAETFIATVTTKEDDSTEAFYSHHRGKTATQRAAACYLITQIPDTGLEDTLETLQEIYDFYSDFPVLESATKTATMSTARGRIATSGVREPLSAFE